MSTNWYRRIDWDSGQQVTPYTDVPTISPTRGISIPKEQLAMDSLGAYLPDTDPIQSLVSHHTSRMTSDELDSTCTQNRTNLELWLSERFGLSSDKNVKF